MGVGLQSSQLLVWGSRAVGGPLPGQQEHLLCWGSGSSTGSHRPTEGTSESGSVQHSFQLVSQGIEHGADVIQDVFGGGGWGAGEGGRTGSG